jgi:hypothetical protein
MTNSPTPNPNRRRRLTADELIAIVVALAGIGTVLFWGLGQNNRSPNLFRNGISSLGNDNVERQTGGALDGESTSSGVGRRTIASSASKERQPPAAATPTLIPPVAPTVKTVEVPVEPTTAPTAIVSAPAAVTPTTAPVSTTPAFTDVPKQFWGETYITALKQRGILDDFGTGKFDPNKQITRGEYAKMLDRAFTDKPANANTANFQDIPADYPRKEAIAKVVRQGFMSGYSPTKFAPNQVIPRYQLQISLAKGLELPVAANTDTILNKFTDAGKMPKFAREKMASAIDAGLTIEDKTKNLLEPTQQATRADAAALIYQVLVKEGKIQPQQSPK